MSIYMCSKVSKILSIKTKAKQRWYPFSHFLCVTVNSISEQKRGKKNKKNTNKDRERTSK